MNHPIVFTDFHHNDLLFSLIKLFEERLGGTCVRPIGLDWYTKGFWNVYPSPDTAEQYLGMRQTYTPPDGTLPLNHLKEGKDFYYCEDAHNGSYNKAITFEQFQAMPIDIVIASIPAHIPLFKRLIQQYKPKAKLIVQMGNNFTEYMNNLHEMPNLLASTIEFPVPLSCNAVWYHQEFSLDIFKPHNKEPKKQITSFINILPKTGHADDFYSLRAIMSNHEFRSYGAQTDDGVINTTREMANMMNESQFGFHAKYMGDGFGHVLYNWYACGRPVITRISDYKGKLGEELLTDEVTCLDLDESNFVAISDMIENMSKEQYDTMCTKAYNRFKQVVSYDEEEQEIRKFLEKLI